MPALTALDRLLAAYAGPSTVAEAPTAGYGTQQAPLEVFYGAGGTTGNKTTNKDLPQWLRALGMKRDAYAGGMLKPELRYGFKYKDGHIYFADGTSFAAKKVKGPGGKISYSYTGADGKATSYSPTDEQHEYNKRYKAATSNQSFFDKATNLIGFELDHAKQLAKDFDVNNVFFGVDPLGVKFGNAVTGRDDKPLVTQLGGAREDRFADYEARTGRSVGLAPEMHQAAATIASMYGLQGLGRLASAGVSSLGTTSGTGGNLGVFGNGGRAGMTGVGGGNAGLLESSGAITGGAGVAGIGGGGGSMPAATGSFNWMDWIPSLISAGSALVGGRQASNAVEAGSREAIGESRRQFDLVRGDTAPIRALGNAATDRLARLYGYGTESGAPDMSAFFESPDHQFNVAEGQSAIDRSLAATGGALSGRGVKEGIRYASGMASREYGSFVDRLMQQAGLGSNGTAQSAAAGATTAANVGNAAINSGNARASIYGNTAANVNNSIQGGFQNQLLRRYLGG